VPHLLDENPLSDALMVTMAPASVLPLAMIWSLVPPKPLNLAQ
jgi:hypothetical protein